MKSSPFSIYNNTIYRAYIHYHNFDICIHWKEKVSDKKKQRRKREKKGNKSTENKTTKTQQKTKS